jgi:hypothetical protein
LRQPKGTVISTITVVHNQERLSKVEQIKDFSQAEKKILDDINRCLESVAFVMRPQRMSLADGIGVLSKLREVAYEEINQIQHEEMLLRAVLFLQEALFTGQPIDWYWNPRQTGDYSEPDIRAVKNGEIMLSAEVTASERPVGIIDVRMRDTLAKLNRMPGRKYYFVRSNVMEQRARTKVEKGGFDIHVKKI